MARAVDTTYDQPGEPTTPEAWGRWAARQGWARGDAQDVAEARFDDGPWNGVPCGLFPGCPSDVALEAFDAESQAMHAEA